MIIGHDLYERVYFKGIGEVSILYSIFIYAAQFTQSSFLTLDSLLFQIIDCQNIPAPPPYIIYTLTTSVFSSFWLMTIFNTNEKNVNNKSEDTNLSNSNNCDIVLY